MESLELIGVRVSVNQVTCSSTATSTSTECGAQSRQPPYVTDRELFAVVKELKYAKSHEWVRVDGDVATIGISDFAQACPQQCRANPPPPQRSHSGSCRTCFLCQLLMPIRVQPCQCPCAAIAGTRGSLLWLKRCPNLNVCESGSS